MPILNLQPVIGQRPLLALTSLDQSVEQLCQKGIAASTHKTYDSAARRFNQFCIKFNVATPFPVSEQLLTYYAVFSVEEGLKSNPSGHTSLLYVTYDHNGLA